MNQLQPKKGNPLNFSLTICVSNAKKYFFFTQNQLIYMRFNDNLYSMLLERTLRHLKDKLRPGTGNPL